MSEMLLTARCPADHEWDIYGVELPAPAGLEGDAWIVVGGGEAVVRLEDIRCPTCSADPLVPVHARQAVEIREPESLA